MLSRTTPALALFAGLLALGACSRPAAEGDTGPAASPPLPDDVRSVAAVATASSPQTTQAGEAGGATASAGARGDNTEIGGLLASGGRLSLTGEFVSPIHSDLVPRTGGRVGRVLVDEGERVRKGQPLLELETEYLELDVKRAEADLARAEAVADEARRDYARKQDLIQRGSVSEAVHQRSRAGAAQADAALAASRTGLELARQRLSDAVLKSPVDGVVAARRTDVGERLGEGAVAFVVEQTAPLKLRFRVPERYLSTVRVGQAVRATVDPYPGAAFDGGVTLVGGSVDPVTRTFLVEAVFANRDGRLRPGLFARVDLDLGGA